MKAIYPGSFDPVHNGHLDLIIRASDLFEHLTVAVYEEANQNVLFSSSERVNLISESILPSKKNVEVVPFSGLAVDFAKSLGA